MFDLWRKIQWSYLINQANLASQNGSQLAAIDLTEKALAVIEKFDAGIDLVATLNYLGQLYISQGRFTDAEPLYLRVLAMREKELGSHHPDVAIHLNNLGDLYTSLNKYVDAESFFLRSLEIREKSIGQDRLSLAVSLINLGQLYVSQSKYDLAEKLHLRAFKIHQQCLPESHPDAVLLINNLAGLYELMGKYSEAESLHLRNLHSLEQNRGSNELDLTSTLNNLGKLYRSIGNYDQAEKIYLRALNAQENCPNSYKKYRMRISILNNLAMLYEIQARYKEAEILYIKSLGDLLIDDNNPNSTIVISSLTSASLEERSYLSDRNDRSYLPFLKIAENISDENLDTAINIIDNLAVLYFHVGRDREAEEIHLWSLKTQEKLPGSDHSTLMASTISNLGNLYRTQGKYGEAELFHSRALKMRESIFGCEHNKTAGSIHSLARVYESQERYKEAETLYRQALKINEKCLGKDHPNTVMQLNSIAQMYVIQEKLNDAEILLLEALSIWEKVLGESHPNTRLVVHNLGGLYLQWNRYELAEDMFLRVLAIDDLSKEKSSRYYATLNNLALLYKNQHKYSEAEHLYDLALQGYQDIPSLDRYHKAHALENLAAVYIETNRYQLALPLLVESVNIKIDHVRDLFFYSDEATRLKQSHLKHLSIHLLLSYVIEYLPEDPVAIQAAATAIIRSKALATEATATLQKLLYNDRYAHLKTKFMRLQDIRQQITNLSLQMEDGIPNSYLDMLNKERQQLEKELSIEVPEIRMRNREVDCTAIANILPTESAIVEFFQFDRYDLKTSEIIESIYIALAIYSKDPASIKLINLGDTTSLDRNIQGLRSQIKNRNNRLTNLGGMGETAERKPLLEKDRELSDRILVPILKALSSDPSFQDVKNLILVPAGSLYLIPFEILPLPNSSTLLLDWYQINYLNSARDLLSIDPLLERQANRSRSAIIVDPDYDLECAQPGTEIGSTSLSSLGDVLKFNRHPEVVALGEKICHRLDGSILYRGIEANEIAIKQIVSPRELVIVTHGFALAKYDRERLFISLVEQSSQLPLQDILDRYQSEIDLEFCQYCEDVVSEVSQKFTTEVSNPESSEKMNWLKQFIAKCRENLDRDLFPRDRLLKAQKSDNPMLRSGLALAGANLWRQGKSLPADLGKGVILAEDIAQMNLWNSELVILIACSTAMGEINLQEGIFGLRRALALAGAKYAIVSLWDVPALASMLLMDFFFDAYDEGIDPHLALRQAQNRVRKISISELRRSSLGNDIIAELTDSGQIHSQPHDDFQPLKSPYFWGAWICQG